MIRGASPVVRSRIGLFSISVAIDSGYTVSLSPRLPAAACLIPFIICVCGFLTWNPIFFPLESIAMLGVFPYRDGFGIHSIAKEYPWI